ncbi:MAG: MBL fold metallo-hydrolase [Planctomycetota bacterium]
MRASSQIMSKAGTVKAVQPTLFDGLHEKNEVLDLPVRRTRLVVLGSSSGGNCSVLMHGDGANHRLTLIDCGLSPRRTRRVLGELGLDYDRIDDVLLTHLDQDHCHLGWAKKLPGHARFHVLHSHGPRARRSKIAWRKMSYFEAGIENSFEISCGARVSATLLAHDAFGVAAFRMDWRDGSSLGYATDLGRATTGLVEALRGVDVLAVESNYCPAMQAESDRPAFLKERITGGAGHLSNQECAELVREIGPARDVVLLHLSRQCNTPELALREHEGRGYSVTVADADQATGFVHVAGAALGV